MIAKRLKSTTEDGYTFFITHDGTEYCLTVEPAYRYNGTQSFDGWFPRFYSDAKFAKGALTRFLGEQVLWTEENIS
jgi:hypothetical protein